MKTQPSLNDINERQNQPEFIGLLKAADAAYSYARRADSARILITLASLVMAIVAAIRSDLANPLAVAGAVGAVVNETIRRIGTVPWSRTGMLLQERFDTELFGLKWKPSVGQKPRDEDRHHWERRFRGDASQKPDWYIDVRGLPRGHAVLLCQRENASWDARLRRLWGTGLLGAAFLWIAAGLVIGVAADWHVWDLVVRWLTPSASALLLAFGSGFKHREIADEKEALITRIEEQLESAPVRSARADKRLLALARDFQDELSRLRAEESRVPGSLYQRLRGEYEDAAAAAAKNWRDKLRRDLGKTDEQADAEDLADVAHDAKAAQVSSPPPPNSLP